MACFVKSNYLQLMNSRGKNLDSPSILVTLDQFSNLVRQCSYLFKFLIRIQYSRFVSFSLVSCDECLTGT